MLGSIPNTCACPNANECSLKKTTQSKPISLLAGPSCWRFISSTFWDPCLLGVLLPYGPGTLTSGATEVDAPPFTGDWTLEGAPDLSHSVIGRLDYTVLNWIRRPALDLHEIRLLSPTPWNSARSCWI